MVCFGLGLDAAGNDLSRAGQVAKSA